MSLESLLSTLADGEFHTGDELGRDLHVSRTAIWKQLKKVEKMGIPLTSIRGKGYRIEGGLDLLSRDLISENLSLETRQLVTSLEVLGVVGSTNINAMTKAVEGNSGYVCTAEQQTAGKGRHQRNWVSPYGANLYFPVVWEFAGGIAALEGLSLAVGVTVADALTNAGIEDVQLKWPNDVLHEQRKLAGILLEITGDAAGPCQVVIGIGINVNMPKTVEIDQPWTDVNSILERAISRNELLARLLNELMPMLSKFEQLGFRAYRDRWQMRDAYYGKEVHLIMGNQIITGTAEGVDDTGAIVVQTTAGRKTFTGGEVSLRGVK